MNTDNGNLAIDLSNVTKQYGKQIHALRGISLRVKRGEIFGLLGPNGAGKSTLVKIMMTVVRATTAEGTILGKPVGHKPTLSRIGYLPENHRFPRYLTGRQSIEFFSSLSGYNSSASGRADELLKLVGMTDWADRKVGQYSKGMMQRIGLAVALGADPDLVVLDEPTDGVDPVGRRDIRDVLLKMRDAGKTVFINSHLLSELESLCDRVAVLVKGQVAVQGTMEELTETRQFYLFELAASPDGVPPPASQFVSVFPDFKSDDASRLLKGTVAPGIWGEFENGVLRIGTTDLAPVQRVMMQLAQSGLLIKRLQPFRPSLEQLFLEAVGNDNTPGAAREAI